MLRFNVIYGEAAHDRDPARRQALTKHIPRLLSEEVSTSLIFIKRLKTPAIMPAIKERKKDEAELWLQEAIRHYQHSNEPSMRSSAEKFGIADSALRGRLKGRQTRVSGDLKMQVLTEFEEKAVARWCERLDEWGHPPRLEVVKGMAEAVVGRREKNRSLGKHWISRFLSRHPGLASKLSSRLDRQRAFASNPVVIKDYFAKVRPVLHTPGNNIH